MKKILNFLYLPYPKKKLFSKSMFFVGLIRLCLWIIPYRLINKGLLIFGSNKQLNNLNDWNLIKEVTYAVRICAKYVPYASCLTQALATQTILRLSGQKSLLKLGVDKDENEKLIAHAWVEIDGKIIIGGSPDITRYSVLTSNKEQFV